VPPKAKSKSDDIDGDYVPYEEIKDWQAIRSP
jgi:hypothetical protein